MVLNSYAPEVLPDPSPGEIYRYLGYRGMQPDEKVADRVRLCVRQLKKVAVPKSIWTYLPLSSPEEGVVQAGDIRIVSRSLYRNLKGCREVCMMAATLGHPVDYTIRRYEVTDLADAVICQAAGAALAEAFCNEVNRRIIEECAERGLYARPRFSPGYGDFALEHQRDFEALLRMSVRCGILLTDTLLMVPGKSVTALIGLSETEQHCVPEGCEICTKRKDCAFSRAGQ